MRKTSSRPIFVFVALAVAYFLVVPTSAYDHFLSSEAIREAYFLGQRNDEATTKFFQRYVNHLPPPERGPYISDISLFTPYAQAVFRSWRNGPGYSAQQAEEDYRHLGDSIQVKVRIEFTATYSALLETKPNKSGSGGAAFALRPHDFWRDFGFKLCQNSTLIDARNTHGEAIYDEGGFRGAEVWLEYDRKPVASEESSVEVRTPDEHKIIAKFDLAGLR
jgi:hypothetical protein